MGYAISHGLSGNTSPQRSLPISMVLRGKNWKIKHNLNSRANENLKEYTDLKAGMEFTASSVRRGRGEEMEPKLGSREARQPERNGLN